MNMQPYQEESSRLRKSEALPADILKGAAGLALSGTLANKISPLLNQFVPENIMQKGLSRINPKLGSFMEQAIDMGFDVNEVRDFLQNKIQPPKPPEKEHPNITQAKDLETRYPNIIKSLMQFIQQGQTPQAAAAIMKNQSQHSKDIKTIEKETGKNFVDLILELLGNQQPAQEAQDQMVPSIQSQQMAPQEMQNQTSPVGAVDPKLIQLLQNIQSGITNLRGRGG